MAAKRFMRGAGILLPVTSLPSDYGIGTLGDEALRFVDLLVDLRQRYWQVLPLGPTSFGDSPYQSFSAFAGNPNLIDLNELIREELLSREEVREYQWGSDMRDIDYAKIFENRVKVLMKAFKRFDLSNNSYQEFCRTNEEWLNDYSFFMALKTFSENREWLLWEPGLRDRDPQCMEGYRQKLSDQIDFWKFCQYKFFEQWDRLRRYANSRGIQIIGDIPLYVALDSADVWAHREDFLLGTDGRPEVVAGCPPDAFSDMGQKWGNPIYNWSKMEREDFPWWRRRMAASAALYDIIRIDHFIGVVRYYTVPAGDLDGRGGKWYKGPGKKLTDAMTEASGESGIIAEDLGVYIPGVKRLMAKTGWPGMKILQFAFDGNPANEHLPHNYQDSNAVVYIGTHDNDTIVGHFRDRSEYELAFLYEYLGISRKEEIPDALIRLAYASVADIVIIQMQDLLKLGNEARMNLPSTIGTNWRWRYTRDGMDEERRTWIRTMAALFRR